MAASIPTGASAAQRGGRVASGPPSVRTNPLVARIEPRRQLSGPGAWGARPSESHALGENARNIALGEGAELKPRLTVEWLWLWWGAEGLSSGDMQLLSYQASYAGVYVFSHLLVLGSYSGPIRTT